MSSSLAPKPRPTSLALSGSAAVPPLPRPAPPTGLFAGGYILLRGAASATELEDVAALERHPLLLRYAEDLCGVGYRLDRPLLSVADAFREGPAMRSGDTRTRDPAREYVNEFGYTATPGFGSPVTPDHGGAGWRDEGRRVRQCQGVVAVWATADSAEGDGFALVPCSHLGNVEPPERLAAGVDLPDPLSVMLQPALRKGDLLLCAEAIMHGLPPSSSGDAQHCCTFISATAPPSFDSPLPAFARGFDVEAAPKAWLEELSPTARAMVAPSVGDETVATDGERVWLAPPEATAEVTHPSLHIPNPAMQADAQELYWFDLNGYLVLRNVLNKQEIQAALTALESGAFSAQPSDELSLEEFPSMAGRGRPGWTGPNLMELPPPHRDVFRKMINHPAVVRRLAWMMGGGAVWDGRDVAPLQMAQGSVGQVIHSGATNPTAAGHGYEFRNGRVFAGANINIAWQLADAPTGAGGFVVAPVSPEP